MASAYFTRVFGSASLGIASGQACRASTSAFPALSPLISFGRFEGIVRIHNLWHVMLAQAVLGTLLGEAGAGAVELTQFGGHPAQGNGRRKVTTCQRKMGNERDAYTRASSRQIR